MNYLFGKDRLSDWKIVGAAVNVRKPPNLIYFHTFINV